MFVCPGLTSDSQTGYVRNIVISAKERGYDVIVINYRGLGDAKLETPRLYSCYSYQDVLEPMTAIYDKFCKNQNRKAFAVGCSMGANILANLVGHQGDDCFLEAACLVQAPMKMWEIETFIQNSACGLYNSHLGKNLNSVITRHQSVLNDHFKANINIDIPEYVRTVKPSIITFDEKITCPCFGYASRAEYYDKASCCHRIPSIKIPCFFMNALDDPVLGEKSIDYKSIRQNPNTILGTTRHGGHLGYHSQLFS